MIKNLTITVVVDNSTSGKLLGEHGLSFYIETDKHKILFDAGRGKAFDSIRNQWHFQWQNILTHCKCKYRASLIFIMTLA